jgi:hypothetical protein
MMPGILACGVTLQFQILRLDQDASHCIAIAYTAMKHSARHLKWFWQLTFALADTAVPAQACVARAVVAQAAVGISDAIPC